MTKSLVHHMVGDYSGEIIQGLGIAIKLGATKADFDDTVGVSSYQCRRICYLFQRVL